MAAATTCVRRKLPVRLVLSTSSQSARFMRSIRPSRVMPALLTSTSILLNFASTAFAAALMEASSAMSSANGSAWPPAARISSATEASLSAVRAARATTAPWAASSSAMARPIPWDAPVTSAIRPSSGDAKFLAASGVLVGVLHGHVQFMVGLDEQVLGLLRVAAHVKVVGALRFRQFVESFLAVLLRGSQMRMASGVNLQGHQC